MKQLIIVTLLSIPFCGVSQSGRLKYADKMYARMSYYYAAEGYEDVIARKTDSSVIASKIATSYDKIGNTQKALDWYRYMQRTNTLTKEQHLRIGLLERQVGNYKKSETLMADYKQKYGSMDVSSDVLQSSTVVEKLRQDNGNFELKLQKVNTENSEIGTSYISSSEVIISSAKRRKMAVKRIYSWTGDYFYDLYRAQVDSSGELEKMKIIKKDLQTKFHDGPAVFDHTTGYVYFTRNNYLPGKKGKDDKGVTRLKVYRAKLEGNKFKKEEEVSGINNDSYSTGHPSLSQDGKRLYFSSDRPGGFGGMDLYSVELDKGQPKGDPVNLGEMINTTQNEIFPMYHSKDNLLFFASEGHIGLGGLDVFVAKLSQSGNVKSIENLGAPINSPVDDFSFVNNEEQTNGYFSSNRDGGKGSDDVYGFIQKTPIKNAATLKGTAKDLLTEHELGNTMMYLADKNGRILDSIVSDETGAFEFILNDLEDDFQIVGSKEGYTRASKTIRFNPERFEYQDVLSLMPVLEYYFTGLITDKESNKPLEGVKITISDANKKDELFAVETSKTEGTFKTGQLPYSYENTIRYNFKLEKSGYVSKTVSLSELLKMKEEINVNGNVNLMMKKIEVGKTDLNDVIAINPIYFDLNKSDIRPDAALELDKIVTVMTENPGMVIELGSHTDSRGSNAINKSLSDKRAKSSAAYIVSKGISRDRIKGKGYGESKLKVSDAEINKAATTEEKETLHQVNRRTEFIIVKMK